LINCEMILPAYDFDIFHQRGDDRRATPTAKTAIASADVL